ncbi:hybrid sensor histidine kinase/response regulator transcription factor [Paraflavitalea sp. CAU 1676]|uniref:hybrid sensor histidine kinase/response regulator transcription factor n=1 Tax=Paraflavitalea sp. CAU 1676 TaxID=3032598 RepID=UPI0023DB147B|nr:hybrid sensor histidine kinase/response regulator transcription factor [Paraflavitalea sp. CAU 1676]MDF2189545.1 two-component regulator propeller domain-containing protein [Paraflavitalea sp. CAU 1676]
MRKLVILVLLCTTGWCLRAQTQQYQFSRIDISQGLSHSQINTIMRDSKGFMWIGTMSGLNRYDGYNFTIYRHNLHDSTTIGDDFIVRIFEGPDNTIWVENRNGLNVFDQATEQFNRNASACLARYALPPASVTSILRDSRGKFWFVMGQAGLYTYDPASRKTVRVFQTDAIALNPVSIGEDNKGDIWVVFNNGHIEKLDGRTGSATFKTDLLGSATRFERLPYSLYIDAENELWCFVSNDPRGVFQYNPATNTLHHITGDSGPFRLNNNLVTGLLQDNKGNIWVFTDHGGVNILNKKKGTSQYLMHNDDDPRSLSQNSLTTGYKDKAGNIWVGTYKKGINYYRERTASFPLFDHQPADPNSLPYNDVNKFIEDAAGNLWIGTNGGGLIYYDRTKKTFRQFLHNPSDPNSLSNNVIVSLFIDHNQKLWIGSYFGGLDCYDGKRFTHYKHSNDPASIADDRVWEIFEDSRKELWVGTLIGGLDRFDRQKNVFHHHLPTGGNSVSSGYIAALMEDNTGKLWIGTANGVDVLIRRPNLPDSFAHYYNTPGNAASLSNNNVITMLQDKKGQIWIGTRDGLNLFDPRKNAFQIFRREDGLPDNAVLTLLEDDAGELWMSSPNGIAHIQLQYDAQKDRYLLLSHNYNELDGLQGTAFNENAAYKTRNGELIFGGANGFNLFHPEAIRPGKLQAPLAFTDLRIFNKTVAVGEKINGRIVLPQSITQTKDITLRYNENVLSIEFAALNFSNAERSKYAYKLDGFNEDWSYTDGRMRMATYTNLDPGDYTFRVKAATSNDVWNDQELTLHIKVLPPFWKTPWAYALYVLVLGAILWFSRHMVLQRARIRFQLEQQRKEAQRMHELDMMKIRFFTNVSHEFRTPLSLILAPVEKMLQQAEDEGQKKQYSLIHRNARRLLNLVNQLLDFRKMEVQELRLNTSTGDIIRFTKDITYSFTDIAEKKNIRFNFHSAVDRFFTSFDHDKLERILFNLVSNAFKFTPEQGSVTVALRLEEQGEGTFRLAIQVKDTGIGIPKEKQDLIFERFFQHDTPGSIVNQGSGIGLSITREFVKLHQGTISVESEPEQGSCFTVILPLQAVPAAALSMPLAATEQTGLNGVAPAGQSITALPVAMNDPEGRAAAITGETGNGVHHAERETTTGNGVHHAEAEAAAGEHEAKKKMLLLVEDNEDFRFYLKDNLRQHFTILEAANGKEGWQKALGHHPDLVVSDISMPEMNGIDLCKKIKKDQRTSHIPVILLTALAGEQQQLKGLETGANDYLTKPFNFEILLSRIRNQLSQQAIARKTFEKRIEVSQAALQTASPDEQFLHQVMELIEKNMGNPEFSVEELSKGVYMSRVALYKKILALTGKTPIEFIRSVRLKRAAQLLEKSQMTVAEIAYEVGFNNPKYFSKYFKLEYHVLPSQWGAQGAG